MKNFRDIPSVEQVLQSAPLQPILLEFGRNLTVEALRQVLDDLRSDPVKVIPDKSEIIRLTRQLILLWTAIPLKSVINATGVILHTNLGRAPLSSETLHAMESVSRGYSNLEFDLQTGSRGTRNTHTEALLHQLTGAESSLVVNNNAAAVLLVLSALAARKPVVISRTQLVEIGGGFRVPDVMRQSGAKLLEVGTTNRTHLDDYRQALQSGARVVVRAHASNFKVIGFTGEPTLQEIVEVTHAFGGLVIDDLGSGTLVDCSSYGLAHEPMVQESVQAGADVVCFSGDKLLGGPQAGIILGRKELLEKIRKHPLARAVRADKTCIAGLVATLLHYRKMDFEKSIPIWQMISCPLAETRSTALRWQNHLGFGELIEGQSTVGGGSLPGESLPSVLFALTVKSPQVFLKKLRELDPPIIARIESDKVIFDPRTVLPGQETEFLRLLMQILH